MSRQNKIDMAGNELTLCGVGIPEIPCFEKLVHQRSCSLTGGVK